MDQEHMKPLRGVFNFPFHKSAKIANLMKDFEELVDIEIKSLQALVYEFKTGTT